MLVDGSLDNLMQGVSQQPNRDRLPGQCTEQLNAVADLVDGWKRRPPTEYIATLLASSTGKWYNYDTGTEQYVILFESDDIRVWDMDGTEYTVDLNHTSYLPSDPDNLALTTIGDYTIVANKTVECAMTTDTHSDVPGALLYFTSGGENEQNYIVYIDGNNAAEWTAPSIYDDDIADGAFAVDYAVEELYDLLVASSYNSTYSFEYFKSTIKMTRRSGSDTIDVAVSDGHSSETTAFVVQGSVTKDSKLPAYGIPGQVVAVTGDSSDNNVDDIYYEFVVDDDLDESFGSSGTWTECCAREIPYKVDSDTMPHALIRLPDGTFYFGQIDGSTQGSGDDAYELESWGEREAGDEDSNPDPYFIGTTVEFVDSFQERMIMLCDDVIHMSTTDSQFDFWLESMSGVLDSDPIESLASGDTRQLKYTVQHNKHLIIFSEETQYIVIGTEAVTPSNFSMPLTTAFNADLDTKPVNGGDVVFFPITYGNYGGVQEFYTSSEVEANNAHAITAHVKRYIDGTIKRMITNPGLGMLLVEGSSNEKNLYLYQYLWEQTERVQSSWGEWLFDYDVKHFWFDAELVYLILDDGTNDHLVKIDMADTDTAVGFNVYLDMRDEYTPDSSLQLTLPYVADKEDLLAVRSDDCPYPGRICRISSVDGYTVTLADDPGGSVYVGFAYKTLYTPSNPKVVDYKGRLISTDRLTLTRFLISYKNTGYFKTELVHPYYDTYTQTFSGRVLGRITDLSTQPIVTGVHSAPIRRNVEDLEFSIYTESYLPLIITNIEWVGQYNKRGKRL